RIEVRGKRISAGNVVVGAGAHPFIPDINGLDDVEYHTSDTIMRVLSLPDNLVIIGGGFIASEMAHVFGALGSRITIINRSPRLLANEDESISERFTQIYAKRFELHMNARFDRVTQNGPN